MNDNCSKHDVDEHLVVIIRTTVTTCSFQYHDKPPQEYHSNITIATKEQPSPQQTRERKKTLVQDIHNQH